MDKLFTGLFDDNGVGIYFGDALRHNQLDVDVIVTDVNGSPVGIAVDGSGEDNELNEGKGWVVIEVTDDELG